MTMASPSPVPPPPPRRDDGARVLTAVVVTLGVGGVAGGTVAWLLRFLALAAGTRPDAGTTGMFLTVMTFVVALLPGAVATALERRRTGRLLLAAGGIAVVVLLAARLDRELPSAASLPAVGVTVLLVAALLAVVVGAVWATAWLTRSAVGPGGSGLAGPTLGGGGPR
jgi:hypothetical protein